MRGEELPSENGLSRSGRYRRTHGLPICEQVIADMFTGDHEQEDRISEARRSLGEEMPGVPSTELPTVAKKSREGRRQLVIAVHR